MKNLTIFLSLFACVVCLMACSETRSKAIGLKSRNGRYQPRIHFSPEKNWMGEPSGLIFLKNKYHLFYEHNPFEKTWGNVHWGHAVSEDLIHWEDRPVSLLPDSLGDIFSGSVVFDVNNTSGLGTKEYPPLIAYYTQYNQMDEEKVHFISIAYSTDGGDSWLKYSDNPLSLSNQITQKYSDPNVFWYNAEKKWIMCLAADNTIFFYSSSDCIHWEYMSEFRNDKEANISYWEKPVLINIKTADKKEKKWVLLVTNKIGPIIGSSSTQYIVGDFDGTEFIASQSGNKDYDFWMDYGKDYNGTVICSDGANGKIISLSWMNCWEYSGQEPTESWSGTLSFPRELNLIKDKSLYLLTSKPINEIEDLTNDSFHRKKIKIGMTPTNIFSDCFTGELPVDIVLNFDLSYRHSISFPENYGFRLKNGLGDYYSIVYNNMNETFCIERNSSSSNTNSDAFDLKYKVIYVPRENICDWRILVDQNSVEFFADSYRISITNTLYPETPFNTIELFTDMGSVDLFNCSLLRLYSVW